jgi:hypothetical protein
MAKKKILSEYEVAAVSGLSQVLKGVAGASRPWLSQWLPREMVVD